ncbi:MAG: hypothetical protein JSW12_06335 [Deltaproteobacteria bacterium]|nr:MAG: hypothetical protein JSW12_06335 [Deltaproteobacteria bacterium]
MFYRGQSIYRISLCLVFLLIFLFLPVTGFSESPPEGLIRSGSVIIQGKTSDTIIVSERHFVVTEATTIVTMEGEKIQLSALPVPCKAEITYQLRMDQDPVTLKIGIKQLLRGSSKTWPPPGSEG